MTAEEQAYFGVSLAAILVAIGATAWATSIWGPWFGASVGVMAWLCAFCASVGAMAWREW